MGRLNAVELVEFYFFDMGLLDVMSLGLFLVGGGLRKPDSQRKDCKQGADRDDLFEPVKLARLGLHLFFP